MLNIFNAVSLTLKKKYCSSGMDVGFAENYLINILAEVVRQ